MKMLKYFLILILQLGFVIKFISSFSDTNEIYRIKFEINEKFDFIKIIYNNDKFNRINVKKIF